MMPLICLQALVTLLQNVTCSDPTFPFCYKDSSIFNGACVSFSTAQWNSIPTISMIFPVRRVNEHPRIRTWYRYRHI
jgi:hypothetical protein